MHNIPLPNITSLLQNQIDAGINPIWYEAMQEDDSAGSSAPPMFLRAARSANYANGATNLRPATAHRLWQNWTEYSASTLRAALAKTKGTPPPTVLMQARLGFPSSLHVAAKHADRLLVERANDDIGNLAPAIAFARGAVHQYKVPYGFGIDESLWWGAIYGCVNDLPASLHKRIMYLTYAAGASILSVEACGWLDRHKEPYAVTKEVDNFGTFMLHSLRPENRGESDALVALIAPSDSGWSERPSWAVSGAVSWAYANIPSTWETSSMDAFLSLAFPGLGNFGYFAYPFGKFMDNSHPPPAFSRTYIDPKYAPSPLDAWKAESPITIGRFENRTAAWKWFREVSPARDPAPFRPEADTRWGAIVDVLVNDTTDDIDWDRILQRYKVVVVTAKMSQAERSALIHFVARGGGTVVLTAGCVDADDAQLTGIVFNGFITAARGWRSTEMESSSVEPLLVAAGAVKAGATVIAHTVPEQAPLIVRNPIGRGFVYTLTLPWMVSATRSMPEVVTALLDHEIAKVQPVRIVSGMQALHWTSSVNARARTRFVTVANNAGAPWNGTIGVRVPVQHCHPGCHNVIADTTCSEWSALGPNEIAINITIGSFDVVVVGIGCT